MIHHLSPPPRLGADHWGRVHREGDAGAPITLPEAERPFWVPEWELDADHWRHRRPHALRAVWAAAIAGCALTWAAILWLVGVL